MNTRLNYKQINDYRLKIGRQCNYPAGGILIDQLGNFDITGVNKMDASIIESRLRNCDFINEVHKVQSGYNFSKINYLGMPDEKYNIIGKIKIQENEMLESDFNEVEYRYGEDINDLSHYLTDDDFLNIKEILINDLSNEEIYDAWMENIYPDITEAEHQDIIDTFNIDIDDIKSNELDTFRDHMIEDLDSIDYFDKFINEYIYEYTQDHYDDLNEVRSIETDEWHGTGMSMYDFI